MEINIKINSFGNHFQFIIIGICTKMPTIEFSLKEIILAMVPELY